MASVIPAIEQIQSSEPLGFFAQSLLEAKPADDADESKSKRLHGFTVLSPESDLPLFQKTRYLKWKCIGL